ncbi:MAG: metallophosphoesterase [Planctomycetota bacterium]|jgi:UDP-2,3-diacylglucosamine pyrophosphatase LpxH
MERKRIYVGDIHMNAGKGFQARRRNGKHSYEWLGPKEAKRFAAFLKYLNNPAEVQEIIIIGDLMDDWVYPVDIVPPGLQSIVNAPINSEIVRELKRLAKNEEITVVYLPGNHDMGVTRELVAKNFRGMVFGGTALYNSVYRTSRLRAEHGSSHAMFNAPDAINSPGVRLPLGYFISRVVATKARETGSVKRHYWAYADDLLETLGPQRLAASVFEAVLEEAGLKESTKIRMPKKNGRAESVTAAQVKERYAGLYDQWKETYGAGIAFKAMMAEIGFLGNLADRLCKSSDTNIVVFGHSHDWKLDKDAWFVSDRIYANCGTWPMYPCEKEESEGQAPMSGMGE